MFASVSLPKGTHVLPTAGTPVTGLINADVGAKPVTLFPVVAQSCPEVVWSVTPVSDGFVLAAVGGKKWTPPFVIVIAVTCPPCKVAVAVAGTGVGGFSPTTPIVRVVAVAVGVMSQLVKVMPVLSC